MIAFNKWNSNTMFSTRLYLKCRFLNIYSSGLCYATWIFKACFYEMRIRATECRRSLVGSVLANYTESQGSRTRPAIKIKYKKYFCGDFLSADVCQKLWELKLPWKLYQKKYCRSESTLNCWSRHLCIKLTRNISGVRNSVNNPDWRGWVSLHKRDYAIICEKLFLTQRTFPRFLLT